MLILLQWVFMVNRDSQNTIIDKHKKQSYLLKSRFRTFERTLCAFGLLTDWQTVDEAARFAIDFVGSSPVGIHQKGPVQVYGYDESLVIKGWAINPKKEFGADRVLLEIDGLLYETRAGIERQDVAQVLKERRYLQSGWQLRLPRGLFQDGNHRLHLLILDPETKTYFRSKAYRFQLVGYNPWMEKDGEQVVFHQSKEEIIRNLYRQLQAKDEHIDRLYQSLSWRITSPMRKTLDVLLLIGDFAHPKVIGAGWQTLRRHGLKAFLQGTRQYLALKLGGQAQVQTSITDAAYQLFLAKTTPSEKEVEALKKAVAFLAYQPLISIITPVYNTEPIWLDRCIQSVCDQYYSNWELCLHDDCSPSQETVLCLEKWAKKDPRVKVSRGTSNLHISGASNEAIKIASGEFVGLLDHDDELTPDALYEVVKSLNTNPETDYFYSDEDKLELNGSRSGPYFKPDFNKDLLLSNNYLCHFSVIRKTVGDKVGWFRKSYEGSQDYDLFLRLMEQTDRVKHIPKVLYHWRKIPGSTALHYDDKGYANRASLQALSDYLERNKIKASVENGLWPGSFRIRRTILDEPSVSIIVPFKDRLDLLKPCVSSILEKTTYSHFELLLVSNNSSEAETLRYLNEVEEDERVRLIHWNEPFNFARLNNVAVAAAKGDFVLLLNNDTEVLNDDWLEAMLEQAQREEVGAVGAKLLYPDDTVQHAGVLLGVGGLANHAFLNLHKDNNLYFGNSNVIRNYSAVSGACLMVKRSTYLELGGMDEKLAVAYNDIDFCLRLRAQNQSIVFTPFAQLYHFESRSRGYEVSEAQKERLKQEEQTMRKKWGSILDEDPFYNPNLSRSKPDFSLNLEG